MNRSERRRAARKGSRATVLDSETGYGVAGLGRTHRSTPMAELPDRVPGRHRWVAVAGYVLTDDQARLGAEGATQVVLSPNMLYVFGISCIDCERPYHQAVRDLCPGAPLDLPGGLL